jgi:hypothetical protein
MASITIKLDDFRYPTLEEMRVVNADTPALPKFNYPYVSELAAIMNNFNRVDEVVRRSNLHWWEHALNNRLGSLLRAYDLAMVNYNRGLPDDVKIYEPQHFVNRVQFGYYGETYFYFFISVRDTIAHLINIYFSMGVPEKRLFINEGFLKKIPADTVKECFTAFLADTELTSDYRNSLAHRYLPTQPDNRPMINHDNGTTYFGASEDEIKSSELLAEIRRSFNSMVNLLNDLKTLLPLADESN